MRCMQCNVTPSDKSTVNPNLRKEGCQTRLTCLPPATPDILTDVIQAVRTASPGGDEGKIPKAAKRCPWYQIDDTRGG